MMKNATSKHRAKNTNRITPTMARPAPVGAASARRCTQALITARSYKCITARRRAHTPDVDVPEGYVVALLLTLAVEIPVYGLGLGWRGLVAGVACNLVTHPLIFIVLPLGPIIGEPIAWGLEVVGTTLIVRGHRKFEQVLTVVVAANVLSLCAGLLL